MKRRGTTLLEALIAVAVLTIGFFAAIRAIVMTAKQTSQATHRNEARKIAKIHIDHAESLAKTNFYAIESKSWQYENSQPYYKTMKLKLSKNYFVREDVKYVVFEQEPSADKDTPYKVRPMIDEDNDGADDYTGQGYDLKEITVTVAWPEKTTHLTITSILNALLSDDKAFFKKYMIRQYSMSTVISSFEPKEMSCCDNPSIDSIEIFTEDGKTVDINNGVLNVSTNYIVRAGLNDQCSSRMPELSLLYWYYGEDSSSAKVVPMKYAGNLNYYVAEVPGEDIKNTDINSGYDAEHTCSETAGAVEPFDMYFQVYAKDNYIGPNCDTDVRESYSDTFPMNVIDEEPPTIIDYTSRIVSQNCMGLIIAKITDGSNGTSTLASERAWYAKMDADGNIGSLIEITDKSGPDGDGNYYWELPQSAIGDWSGNGTFDDKPDIYYHIEVEDTCGNTAATPTDVNVEKPTVVTVTDDDINPPIIYLGYNGLGFEDCIPYKEEKIPINFMALDECELKTVGFSIISKDTGAVTNTWLFDVSGKSYYTLDYSIYPPSRNDIKFAAYAIDAAGMKNWAPSELGDTPNIIHQSNALYYDNTDSDPFASGDVTLQGPFNDTVSISLTNYRDGDIYLYSLDMEEPVYKSICVSSGDTSVAFPYIDRVTLETYAADGSNYKRNVIWDWESGEPNPGYRKRAPIEIFFQNQDPDKNKIEGYGSRAILYLHFMDRATDDPYPAQPFAMDQMDYNLILKADPAKDYHCSTNLEFSTKTVGFDFPPIANAGQDKIGTVGYPIYFEGRASVDCDNDKDELSFYWDFGDGMRVSGATAWHTYDQSFYYQKKAEQGITDTSPVMIDVTLTVTDPSGESDMDTCIVSLFPSGSDIEICDNGVDDDGDGLVDCEDPDCSAAANCNPSITEICNNGIDDDGDGLVDCDDPDCSSASNCVNQNQPPVVNSFICSSVDNLTLKFDVYVADPDDSSFNYSIDWGDGNASTYSDDNTLTATHTYSRNLNANLTVTVTVTDSVGNVATASTSVACSGRGSNTTCTCQ